MGCNECTHPACQHSIAHNGVSECVECEFGVLVLDTTSGPKWRMACNKYVIVCTLNIDLQEVKLQLVFKLEIK